MLLHLQKLIEVTPNLNQYYKIILAKMFNIYCCLVEIYVRAVKEIEKKSAIQVIVTNMKFF